jgi:hypothetical protein
MIPGKMVWNIITKTMTKGGRGLYGLSASSVNMSESTVRKMSIYCRRQRVRPRRMETTRNIFRRE